MRVLATEHCEKCRLAVAELRELLEGADGLIISSPEYAHGVPGSLKNALDWLVSDGKLVGLPVVLINATPGGGERAQRSLLETLSVMNWNVLVEASLLTPFVRQRLDSDGNVSDPDIIRALRNSLDRLAEVVGHGAPAP